MCYIWHNRTLSSQLLNSNKLLKFAQCDATPAFILLDNIGHLVNQPILGGQINRTEELSKSYG